LGLNAYIPILLYWVLWNFHTWLSPTIPIMWNLPRGGETVWGVQQFHAPYYPRFKNVFHQRPTWWTNIFIALIHTCPSLSFTNMYEIPLRWMCTQEVVIYDLLSFKNEVSNNWIEDVVNHKILWKELITRVLGQYYRENKRWGINI
jgi:hypothetical protein